MCFEIKMNIFWNVVKKKVWNDAASQLLSIAHLLLTSKMIFEYYIEPSFTLNAVGWTF